MAIDYPLDENIYKTEFENQYLFGDSILVCPVESTKKITKVYLPKGDWYYLFNDKKYSNGEHFIECPIERLPVFVKAGSVICSQSVVQNLDEKSDGCLRLHLYNNGESEVCLYEDDGNSLQYENGGFLKIIIAWDAETKSLNFTSIGDYNSEFSSKQIVLHGFKEVKHIYVNGEKIEVENAEYQWIEPISNFDPFFTTNDNSQLTALVLQTNKF